MKTPFSLLPPTPPPHPTPPPPQVEPDTQIIGIFAAFREV